MQKFSKAGKQLKEFKFVNKVSEGYSCTSTLTLLLMNFVDICRCNYCYI